MAKGNNGNDGNGGEYMRLTGKYLELRILATGSKMSASGKSTVLATTGGFQPIEGSDAKLNLTLITKR